MGFPKNKRNLGGEPVFVAIELGVSIALMTWLGCRFGLAPKLTSLLAIIAAKGAIDADDEDASYAIAAILCQAWDFGQIFAGCANKDSVHSLLAPCASS